MGSPRRRRLTMTASVVAIVPIAVLAAGCGGGASSSGTPGTTTTRTAARGAAFTVFTTCLKQHGIAAATLGGFGRRPVGASGARPRIRAGSGPAGGSGVRGGAFFGRNLTAAQQKAFTACRDKLPAGTGRFPAGGPGGQGGSRNPAFAKYTQCLGEHGVTFGSSTSAVFRKASAACAKLRPAVGGAAPSSTTTSP